MQKAPNIRSGPFYLVRITPLVFVPGVSIDPFLHFFADVLYHRSDLFG